MSQSRIDFTRPRRFLFWFACIGLTLLIFLISFGIGYYEITPLTVIKIMFSRWLPIEPDWPPQMEIIVFNIRLPRILAAMLVGAAISAAGAAYQGMFKNPLASPDVLGVMQGAGFGAALAIILGLSSFNIQLLAMLFGLGVVGIATMLASRIRYGQTMSLLLAGILLGTLATAGTTMLKYMADTNEQLPAITYWLMGSLAGTTFADMRVPLIPILIGTIILLALRWRMNALTLSDEEAQSLGVNTRLLRFTVILGATLMSAAAVCIGGIITWVGLIVPHIMRMFTGPEYSRLIPASFFGGACFLLIVDNLARSLSVMEIPLGVLTSLFAIPFFLRLILKQHGE